MLRRPGVVSIQLDSAGENWREHVVPFPDKGPLGDVRDSRFVDVERDQLRTICDQGVEFKLGIAAKVGVAKVRFDFDEGPRFLTRRFVINADGRYLHGAPTEIFNAPDLPYFELESHGAACKLERKRCSETVLTAAYFPPQRFQAMRNSAAFAARRSNSSALKSFPTQRR